jgi:hypothetical protein
MLEQMESTLKVTALFWGNFSPSKIYKQTNSVRALLIVIIQSHMVAASTSKTPPPTSTWCKHPGAEIKSTVNNQESLN